MDGLVRKVVSYFPVCIKRGMSTSSASPDKNTVLHPNPSHLTSQFNLDIREDDARVVGAAEDVGVDLQAYVVAGRDVLMTWDKNPTVSYITTQ